MVKMKPKRFSRRKNDTVKTKRKFPESVNGSVPFWRAVKVSFILMIAAIVMSYIVYQEWVLYPPPSVIIDSVLFTWIMASLVAPHAVLYLFGVIIALYIFPQQSLSYSRWLFSKHIFQIVVVFILMESLLILLIGLGFYSFPSDSFIALSTDQLSKSQAYAWNIATIILHVPAWIGLKTGWKIYRYNGAQTAQERLDADIRKMEIKNSGQVWDKVIARYFKKIFGWDGEKPRGGFLWFLVVGFCTFIIGLTTVTFTGNVQLFGIIYFLCTPFVLSLFAAILKFHDGILTLSRPEYLNAVRFPDTDDSYDTSHSGIRVFNRD